MLKITRLIFPALLFFSNSIFAQFAPPVQLTEPAQKVYQATAADLDGDGDADVVCGLETKIFWQQQVAPGIFGQPRLIFEGQRYFGSLAATDLDGDGDLDLCATTVSTTGSPTGGTLGVFFNDGSGQFGPRQLVFTSSFEVQRLAIEDLDSDGDPDIVLAHGPPYNGVNDRVAWFKNNGNGTFGGELLISNLHNSLLSIATADLDSDGDPDVLAASVSDDKLAWYENLGNGNFGAQQLFAPLTEGAAWVRAADLNGDNLPDVVSSNRSPGSPRLIWHKNLGGGDFGIADTIVAASGYPEMIAFADLDADGDLDLLEKTSAFIYHLLNDGSGNFDSPVSVEDDLQTNSLLETPDLNSDGLPDLLHGSADGAFLSWSANLGQGSFSTLQTLWAGMSFTGGFDAADLNADGHTDLLVGSNYGETLLWLPNDGEGNLLTQRVVAKKLAYNVLAAAGDFNGDGLRDIVSNDDFFYDMAWYANIGNGEFEKAGALALSPPVTDLREVAAADLDADGDLDILCFTDGNAAGGTGALSWFRNNGDGTFAANATILSNLSYGIDFEIADLDGNPYPDIVLAVTQPEPFRHLQFQANGQFSTPEEIVSDFVFATGIETFDINQDGLVDLMGVDEQSGKVAWWQNLGGGSFGPQQVVFDDDEIMSSIRAGDLDLDGKPDLLVSTFDGSLYWLRQTTSGSFSEKMLIHEAGNDYGIYRMQLFDADHDGDLDVFTLVSSNYWGIDNDAIFYYRNLANDKSMSGRVFFDENGNGTQDAGEANIGRFPLKVFPKAQAVFTTEQGTYSIYAPAETYNIRPELADCWELTTFPDEYEVDFNGITSIGNLNFGVNSLGTTPVAAVNLTSAATRCGFTVPFWFNVSNNGCLPFGGRAFLVQSDLATLLSAEVQPSFVSGDTLFWNLDSLLPGENRQVKLVFEVAGVAFLGQQITMTSGVQNLDNQGAWQSLAESGYRSTINCAYDPNDKQVSPRRSEQPPFDANFTLFGERLDYTIRFQNTGTDTAFNIVIRDTLSPDLDWASFLPGSASHPYEATLHEGGLLEFHFRDILLPDSNINEQGSHGYVQFSIQAKPGVAEGSVIENKAGIYFDFNPPILTNTVSSVMVEILPNFTPQAAFSFVQTDWTAQFTDLSTNTPTAWLWDFGDGGAANEQHPAHTYAAPGEYEICLTASNAWGSHQTCQELVIITGTGNRQQGAVIAFPNPVRSGERILLKGLELPENERLLLKNSLGQAVGSLLPVTSGSGVAVWLPNLPGGVYFLEKKGMERWWVLKIVVE